MEGTLEGTKSRRRSLGLVVHDASLQLRFAEQSGIRVISEVDERVPDVLTEVDSAFDFVVGKSTAEVGDKKRRIIGLMRKAHQTGKSIQVLADGFVWLLADTGKFVDAQLECIGMTKMLDEEFSGMVPGQTETVLLPELEINKLCKLVEQVERPR